MIINGKKIASFIESKIKKEVKKLKKKPSLAVFLIGEDEDQLSFVKIKEKTAKKLGINYKLIHLKNTPNFITLARLIKKEAEDEDVSGIIIQQPLPAQLSTDSLYDFIPKEKEIEGHRKKTDYYPPIGLAVLTLLKYIFSGQILDKRIIAEPVKDQNFFKRFLKNKKILLIGRGKTGGEPIAKTLQQAKISFLNIFSKTQNKEEFIRNADIIITAVGKKVIEGKDLKKGVILINVGLRKEKEVLKGDYDEEEVKKIASFYTPTPGGIGPIDVCYLYKNLIYGLKKK